MKSISRWYKRKQKSCPKNRKNYFKGFIKNIACCKYFSRRTSKGTFESSSESEDVYSLTPSTNQNSENDVNCFYCFDSIAPTSLYQKHEVADTLENVKVLKKPFLVAKLLNRTQSLKNRMKKKNVIGNKRIICYSRKFVNQRNMSRRIKERKDGINKYCCNNINLKKKLFQLSKTDAFRQPFLQDSLQDRRHLSFLIKKLRFRGVYFFKNRLDFWRKFAYCCKNELINYNFKYRSGVYIIQNTHLPYPSNFNREFFITVQTIRIIYNCQEKSQLDVRRSQKLREKEKIINVTPLANYQTLKRCTRSNKNSKENSLIETSTDQIVRSIKETDKEILMSIYNLNELYSNQEFCLLCEQHALKDRSYQEYTLNKDDQNDLNRIETTLAMINETCLSKDILNYNDESTSSKGFIFDEETIPHYVLRSRLRPSNSVSSQLEISQNEFIREKPEKRKLPHYSTEDPLPILKEINLPEMIKEENQAPLLMKRKQNDIEELSDLLPAELSTENAFSYADKLCYLKDKENVEYEILLCSYEQIGDTGASLKILQDKYSKGSSSPNVDITELREEKEDIHVKEPTKIEVDEIPKRKRKGGVKHKPSKSCSKKDCREGCRCSKAKDDECCQHHQTSCEKISKEDLISISKVVESKHKRKFKKQTVNLCETSSRIPFSKLSNLRGSDVSLEILLPDSTVIKDMKLPDNIIKELTSNLDANYQEEEKPSLEAFNLESFNDDEMKKDKYLSWPRDIQVDKCSQAGAICTERSVEKPSSLCKYSSFMEHLKLFPKFLVKTEEISDNQNRSNGSFLNLLEDSDDTTGNKLFYESSDTSYDDNEYRKRQSLIVLETSKQDSSDALEANSILTEAKSSVSSYIDTLTESLTRDEPELKYFKNSIDTQSEDSESSRSEKIDTIEMQGDRWIEDSDTDIAQITSKGREKNKVKSRKKNNENDKTVAIRKGFFGEPIINKEKQWSLNYLINNQPRRSQSEKMKFTGPLMVSKQSQISDFIYLEDSLANAPIIKECRPRTNFVSLQQSTLFTNMYSVSKASNQAIEIKQSKISECISLSETTVVTEATDTTEDLIKSQKNCSTLIEKITNGKNHALLSKACQIEETNNYKFLELLNEALKMKIKNDESAILNEACCSKTSQTIDFYSMSTHDPIQIDRTNESKPEEKKFIFKSLQERIKLKMGKRKQKKLKPFMLDKDTNTVALYNFPLVQINYPRLKYLEKFLTVVVNASNYLDKIRNSVNSYLEHQNDKIITSSNFAGKSVAITIEDRSDNDKDSLTDLFAKLSKITNEEDCHKKESDYMEILEASIHEVDDIKARLNKKEAEIETETEMSKRETDIGITNDNKIENQDPAEVHLIPSKIKMSEEETLQQIISYSSGKEVLKSSEYYASFGKPTPVKILEINSENVMKVIDPQEVEYNNKTDGFHLGVISEEIAFLEFSMNSEVSSLNTVLAKEEKSDDTNDCQKEEITKHEIQTSDIKDEPIDITEISSLNIVLPKEDSKQVAKNHGNCTEYGACNPQILLMDRQINNVFHRKPVNRCEQMCLNRPPGKPSEFKSMLGNSLHMKYISNEQLNLQDKVSTGLTTQKMKNDSSSEITLLQKIKNKIKKPVPFLYINNDHQEPSISNTFFRKRPFVEIPQPNRDILINARRTSSGYTTPNKARNLCVCKNLRNRDMTQIYKQNQNVRSNVQEMIKGNTIKITRTTSPTFLNQSSKDVPRFKANNKNDFSTGTVDQPSESKQPTYRLIPCKGYPEDYLDISTSSSDWSSCEESDSNRRRDCKKRKKERKKMEKRKKEKKKKEKEKKKISESAYSTENQENLIEQIRKSKLSSSVINLLLDLINRKESSDESPIIQEIRAGDRCVCPLSDGRVTRSYIDIFLNSLVIENKQSPILNRPNVEIRTNQTGDGYVQTKPKRAQSYDYECEGSNSYKAYDSEKSSDAVPEFLRLFPGDIKDVAHIEETHSVEEILPQGVFNNNNRQYQKVAGGSNKSERTFTFLSFPRCQPPLKEEDAKINLSTFENTQCSELENGLNPKGKPVSISNKSNVADISKQKFPIRSEDSTCTILPAAVISDSICKAAAVDITKRIDVPETEKCKRNRILNRDVLLIKNYSVHLLDKLVPDSNAQFAERHKLMRPSSDNILNKNTSFSKHDELTTTISSTNKKVLFADLEKTTQVAFERMPVVMRRSDCSIQTCFGNKEIQTSTKEISELKNQCVNCKMPIYFTKSQQDDVNVKTSKCIQAPSRDIGLTKTYSARSFQTDLNSRDIKNIKEINELLQDSVNPKIKPSDNLLRANQQKAHAPKRKFQYKQEQQVPSKRSKGKINEAYLIETSSEEHLNDSELVENQNFQYLSFGRKNELQTPSETSDSKSESLESDLEKNFLFLSHALKTPFEEKTSVSNKTRIDQEKKFQYLIADKYSISQTSSMETYSPPSNENLKRYKPKNPSVEDDLKKKSRGRETLKKMRNINEEPYVELKEDTSISTISEGSSSKAKSRVAAEFVDLSSLLIRSQRERRPRKKDFFTQKVHKSIDRFAKGVQNHNRYLKGQSLSKGDLKFGNYESKPAEESASSTEAVLLLKAASFSEELPDFLPALVQAEKLKSDRKMSKRKPASNQNVSMYEVEIGGMVRNLLLIPEKTPKKMKVALANHFSLDDNESLEFGNINTMYNALVESRMKDYNNEGIKSDVESFLYGSQTQQIMLEGPNKINRNKDSVGTQIDAQKGRHKITAMSALDKNTQVWFLDAASFTEESDIDSFMETEILNKSQKYSKRVGCKICKDDMDKILSTISDNSSTLQSVLIKVSDISEQEKVLNSNDLSGTISNDSQLNTLKDYELKEPPKESLAKPFNINKDVTVMPVCIDVEFNDAFQKPIISRALDSYGSKNNLINSVGILQKAVKGTNKIKRKKISLNLQKGSFQENKFGQMKTVRVQLQRSKNKLNKPKTRRISNRQFEDLNKLFFKLSEYNLNEIGSYSFLLELLKNSRRLYKNIKKTKNVLRQSTIVLKLAMSSLSSFMRLFTASTKNLLIMRQRLPLSLVGEFALVGRKPKIEDMSEIRARKTKQGIRNKIIPFKLILNNFAVVLDITFKDITLQTTYLKEVQCQTVSTNVRKEEKCTNTTLPNKQQYVSQKTPNLSRIQDMKFARKSIQSQNTQCSNFFHKDSTKTNKMLLIEIEYFSENQPNTNTCPSPPFSSNELRKDKKVKFKLGQSYPSLPSSNLFFQREMQDSSSNTSTLSEDSIIIKPPKISFRDNYETSPFHKYDENKLIQNLQNANSKTITRGLQTDFSPSFSTSTNPNNDSNSKKLNNSKFRFKSNNTDSKSTNLIFLKNTTLTNWNRDSNSGSSNASTITTTNTEIFNVQNRKIIYHQQKKEDAFQGMQKKPEIWQIFCNKRFGKQAMTANYLNIPPHLRRNASICARDYHIPEKETCVLDYNEKLKALMKPKVNQDQSMRKDSSPRYASPLDSAFGLTFKHSQECSTYSQSSRSRVLFTMFKSSNGRQVSRNLQNNLF